MSSVWAELFPAGQFLSYFLWFEMSPGMVCSLFPLGNFSGVYPFLLLKIYLQFILGSPVLNALPTAPVTQFLSPVSPTW